MLEAIGSYIDLQVIAFLFLGVMVGIIGGGLPGITPSMTITLLLPISLYLSFIPSIALLLGAYQGAMFGGSISAILINTPGTAAGAATALDGYPLAQQGHARKAIQMALYSSCTGGFVGCIILILGAQGLSRLTLKFGPPEYFALMVMSMILIAGISGKSMLKGIIAAGLGLLASTVGTEIIFGARRFTFGSINLYDGFPTLSLFIGLFAMSEVLLDLLNPGEKLNAKPALVNTGKDRITLRDNIKQLYNMIFSGILGALMGILPGIGGSTAAFLAYAEAQRRSKTPEKFGTGHLAGIAAPEAANNGVCGGALVPMLTLGIPGDVVTAVLIGALIAQGIAPGPLMFIERIHVVYIIYVGLALATIALVIVGTLGIPLFSKVIKMRKSILLPCISIICVIGTYAARSNPFDCLIMLGFGVIGYFMKRTKVPISPMVISFVVGKQMENSLRQSLILSDGSLSIFFTRPITLGLLIVAAVACLLMVRRNIVARKK